MWNWKIHLAVIVALLLTGRASAQLPSQTAKGAWPETTIHRIKEPVVRTVQQVATETGLALDVSPELREQKMVVLVEHKPAHEVLERIGKVLGAVWVRQADTNDPKKVAYVLTRTEAAQQWATWYLKQRDLAEQYARQRQAERVVQSLVALQQAASLPDDKSDNKDSPTSKNSAVAQNSQILTGQAPPVGDEPAPTPQFIRKNQNYKPDVARALAFLTPSDIDTVARGAAAQSRIFPCANNSLLTDMSAGPFLVYPLANLDSPTQEVFTAIYNKIHRKTLESIATRPVLVGLTSQMTGHLQLALVQPTSHPEARPDMGFGGYDALQAWWLPMQMYSEGELSGLLQGELTRRLPTKPIPTQALLGANWLPAEPPASVNKPADEQARETKRVVLTPGVTVAGDKAALAKTLAAFRNPTPYTRASVLQNLASTAHLNIISDYYTEGRDETTRLETIVGQMEKNGVSWYPFYTELQRNTQGQDDPLVRLARRLGCIVRVEDGYLLCRKADWPLRDRTEIPYPFVENWLAEKEQYGTLFLDTRVAMARQSPLQLDTLYAYEYGDNVTNLQKEIDSARFNSGVDKNDETTPVLYQLPPDVVKQALEPDGIPMSKIPPETRRALRRIHVDMYGNKAILRIVVKNAKSPTLKPVGGREKPVTAPDIWKYQVVFKSDEEPDTFFWASMRPDDAKPLYQ